MPAPRPFGVGPYGAGPYSRYAGTIYECGGISSITFDAMLRGAVRVRNAEATTQIVFSTHALLAWSWVGWAPCATGGWEATPSCGSGAWLPPGACSEGAWTPTRLV